MRDNSRASIAFLATKILLPSFGNTSMYDYGARQYVFFTFQKSVSRLSVYDYGRRCYISGYGNSYYDYGRHSFIRIENVKNNSLIGYDYETHSHFSASIRNQTLWMYDYENRQYYSYGLG